MLAIQRAFTIYEDVCMKNVWCNIMEKIDLFSDMSMRSSQLSD
jgi:hypothetical protein